MTLEDRLDELEEKFKNCLDEQERKIQEEDFDQNQLEEIIGTQNKLLKLLYDAVTYAHESDYPSHFSSEIKKVDQIINDFQSGEQS